MKIINQKGKLFGIINLVDLLVLLAVVAVALGIGVKLFGAQIQEVASPTTTMITTLRIRGASTFMQDELQRNDQVGKKLVSGNEFVAATIESVTFEPYVTQAVTAEGIIVDAIDPTKKDIVISVKSSEKKDTATPKIGNQEVRAGRTMIFKTNDFETIAGIDSVVFQ